MTLSPAFLDELRTRTSLSALIGRQVKLTRAGREWKACCPFHKEKTPSFTINAKPELEIFADDVKCAHGATVGELDRNALFYLASRGVPKEEAKALLTQAFVADAIDRIGEEAVREAFHENALAWLNPTSLVPSEVEGRS